MPSGTGLLVAERYRSIQLSPPTICLRLLYGQGDDERRPGAKLARYLYGSLMQVHNLLGDGEPKPAAFLRALPCLVRLVETLKDVRLVLFSDAYACIRNPAFDVAALPMHRHRHASALRGKFDTVMEEVAPNLTEEIFIGSDDDLIQRGAHVDELVGPVGLTGHNQSADLLVQPVWFAINPHMLRFERRKFQHVVGHFGEPHAFCFDDREIMVSVCRTELVIVERLGKPTDGGKRRLDFVRDVGDEILPQVFHLA